jgi:hypothetical protein
MIRDDEDFFQGIKTVAPDDDAAKFDGLLGAGEADFSVGKPKYAMLTLDKQTVLFVGPLMDTGVAPGQVLNLVGYGGLVASELENRVAALLCDQGCRIELGVQGAEGEHHPRDVVGLVENMDQTRDPVHFRLEGDMGDACSDVGGGFPDVDAVAAVGFSFSDFFTVDCGNDHVGGRGTGYLQGSGSVEASKMSPSIKREYAADGLHRRASKITCGEQIGVGIRPVEDRSDRFVTAGDGPQGDYDDVGHAVADATAVTRVRYLFGDSTQRGEVNNGAGAGVERSTGGERGWYNGLKPSRRTRIGIPEVRQVSARVDHSNTKYHPILSNLWVYCISRRFGAFLLGLGAGDAGDEGMPGKGDEYFLRHANFDGAVDMQSSGKVGYCRVVRVVTKCFWSHWQALRASAMFSVLVRRRRIRARLVGMAMT